MMNEQDIGLLYERSVELRYAEEALKFAKQLIKENCTPAVKSRLNRFLKDNHVNRWQELSLFRRVVLEKAPRR